MSKTEHNVVISLLTAPCASRLSNNCGKSIRAQMNESFQTGTTGAPYRYVRWSRDDMLLLDTRNPDLPVPLRVQLWKNSSLEVSTVQMEDTGDYTCEITTEGGRAIQQHAIEVQYPPTIAMYPVGRVEVKVGQIVEVVCDATGVPQPYVTWNYKNENASASFENNRKLSILVESKDFAGPIECQATNGVGDPAVETLDLVVDFELPEITETTSQLGADGDYADEDGGQEDPNITDNVIPRDFYDYEQQFTSESRTDGERGGSGAGRPTGPVCMGVVSWVVVLICSSRVFRE
ncbi:lachesin [Culex quinquefasciatus]|uniref:Lachesin n=1 Tax=Culex quinquefasciatus TaxID=7176 RepID=B0WGU0_CULQU|nr:lachesin [Culex quinquefasciatus]|eukprot:XP_001847924.1 lachesin [Culex quinquefasciatus]